MGSVRPGGLISNPNPSPTVRAMGYRDGLGNALQPVPADYRAYCHGSEPRSKEIFSIRLGDFARRHGRPSVFCYCGTILIIGALLFLPVAALGPLAEHFGPIPFGG